MFNDLPDPEAGNRLATNPAPVDPRQSNPEDMRGMLRRLMDLVRSLAGRGGRKEGAEVGGSGGSSGGSSGARDEQEARGIFKGGLNDQGEYETGTQRKRRVLAEQGRSAITRQMGDNKGDVKTSVSDAAASIAAREKRQGPATEGDRPEVVYGEDHRPAADTRTPGQVQSSPGPAGDDENLGATIEQVRAGQAQIIQNQLQILAILTGEGS